MYDYDDKLFGANNESLIFRVIQCNIIYKFYHNIKIY